MSPSDSEPDSDLELDLSSVEGDDDLPRTELNENVSSSDEDSSDEESSSEDSSSDDDCKEEQLNAEDVVEGSEADGDAAPPTQEQLQQQREANVQALLADRLNITRKPVLPKLLSVSDVALVLRKPFKCPHPDAPSRSEALQRALAARRHFVPWGSGKPFQPVRVNLPESEQVGDASAPAAAPAVELPPDIEPLVLWEAPAEAGGATVQVDAMLTRWLRPHQREGVQFMFECVAGLREFEGNGCILADDMGLGKTLQGIALLWTLLNSGHDLLGGSPMARRVIICCPTSLVANWDSECTKWLNGRVHTLALCESSRDDVVAAINQFLSPRRPAHVLIVSYETFRLHADRLKGEGACDLLICDEAHRLKNDQTLTNRALGSLQCRRRVLLSGTPMQNQLQEFYAMVGFANPGILGTPAQFRRHFEAPILAGREPNASDAEAALGAERSAELSAIVNKFILRRTNALLSAHLPPKVVELVCCRMTPLQYELYCHFVQSRSVRSLFASHKSARVLSAITSLRKLLNHPKLIYDMMQSAGRGTGGADGFEDCERLFPEGLFDAGRGGARGGGLPVGWEALSGKFAVVARMLSLLREQTSDRIVIVSNFTQTLDLFSTLCREQGYPFLRLDGSTTINKRQKLVKRFNDPADNQFVFLLSSKAGGCGLNLVGGNRLILFDMSWNPADDKQAAARVWRDGQKRRVYVYKFMTTGTIEEKVFQRQLSKEGLQQVVEAKEGASSRAGANLMSLEQLRDLFSYSADTLSTTYDHMVSGAGRQQCRADSEGDAVAGRKKAAAAANKAERRGLDDSSEEEEDSRASSGLIEDSDEEAEAAGTAGACDQERQGKCSPASSEIDGCARIEVVGGASHVHRQQVGKPKEEDLKSWGHHSDAATVPDAVLQLAAGEEVTFVFSCQIDGKDVGPEAPVAPRRAQGAQTKAAGRPLRPTAPPRAAAVPPPIKAITSAVKAGPGPAAAKENSADTATPRVVLPGAAEPRQRPSDSKRPSAEATACLGLASKRKKILVSDSDSDFK